MQVALLMAVLIVCGVLGVAGLMKLHGYGLPHMMDPSLYEWSTLAVFFRNHGFQLLWLPVVWTTVAVIAQRRDRGEFHTGVVVVGWGMMVIFVTLFFLAAVRPVKERWHVFLHRGKSAEQGGAKNPAGAEAK